MKNPLAALREAIASERRHFLVAVALLVVVVLAMRLHAVNVARAAILVIDSYVVLLLWAATQRATHKRADGTADRAAVTWPGLPRLDAAIIQLTLLFVSLLVAFATLYMAPGALGGIGAESVSYVDALYFSLVTMSTVGFGDIYPVSDVAKLTVMVQIASSLLILVSAIPIVVSRLASAD